MNGVVSIGQPKSPSLMFMFFVSILGHAAFIVIFLLVPGLLPRGKTQPFGGPAGGGGLDVMTVDFGLGQQNKPAAKPADQQQPAPARYITKTTKKEEVPLESKTSLPDPNAKKKKTNEPTEKSTLNQPERKMEGPFGKGTDTSKDAGKTGNNGHGKSGVASVGVGEAGPGGYGTGTGVAFPFPWYIDAVFTKLEINWVKPYLVNAEPREYTAVVYFVIQRNGQVSKVEVEQSSGIAALDRSAESAVLGAAPFPPLPNQWTEPELAFRVRFTHTP